MIAQADPCRTERPSDAEIDAAGLSLPLRELLDAAWDLYEDSEEPWSPTIDALCSATVYSDQTVKRNADQLRQRNLWPGQRRPSGTRMSPAQADRVFRRALAKQSAKPDAVPLGGRESVPLVGPRCRVCRSIKPGPAARCPACGARPVTTPPRESLIAKKPDPATVDTTDYVTITEAREILGKCYFSLTKYVNRGAVRTIEKPRPTPHRGLPSRLYHADDLRELAKAITPPPTEADKWITQAEAAHMLGITIKRCRRLLLSEPVTSHGEKTARRLLRADIEALAARRGAPAPAPAPVITEDPNVRRTSCETCDGELAKNGRCYACRPQIIMHGPSAQKHAAKPVEPKAREPEPAIASPAPAIDLETDAIAIVHQALKPLDSIQRAAVLAWARARFGEAS